VFEGLEADVTEENIQARIRGGVLMALSNKLGRLLLATGNKSELAVGYATLYGDMCGGMAVIGDVPKTLVYRLANHLNRERETIPVSTITKPPSAELRPDQTDQDGVILVLTNWEPEKIVYLNPGKPMKTEDDLKQNAA